MTSDDVIGGEMSREVDYYRARLAVSKLAAICVRCGGSATRSHRLGGGVERVEVGGADAYEARCRACARVGAPAHRAPCGACLRDAVVCICRSIDMEAPHG